MADEIVRIGSGALSAVSGGLDAANMYHYYDSDLMARRYDESIEHT